MSWVFVASSSDFPLQNLPFGVFSRKTADPCELRKWGQKKPSKKERVKHGKKTKSVTFGDDTPKSVGVRIGDFILDLRRLSALGFFGKPKSALAHALSQETLNAFMGLTQAEWSSVRASVTELLSADNDSLQGSTVRVVGARA
jgi:fumarylacetoacetase